MSTHHASSFVRHEALPPSPPPTTQTGPLRWLRDNLFSNIPNSIMTLVAIYLIVSLILGILPWLANGVWDAESIRDCRAQLEGATGGCFAVIAERWPQLIFGSYPKDLLMRPTLAFVLFLAAAAPVLFTELPRKLLIFTGLYPFIGFWLIWGGSIWVPVMGLAGFGVGFAVFRWLETRSFFGAMAAGFFAALFFWSFISGFIVMGLDAIAPIAMEKVESRLIGGFTVNFLLGAVCMTLSLPLGILLALGRQTNLPIIRGICVVFIEFIRGVPLITLLFVASVMLAYFLPPGSNFDIISRVIIMITLFAAAYIAEAIRGGLAALPKGQYEAADALGLDYWQAMRLIILPQALKIAIPSIVNIAISLFKDTTLVSIISMFDLLGIIRGPILATTEWFGIYWELYGFSALLFFVVCYSISQYSQYLERKLATDRR
ncbi:MAG: amino acid ABC transporter permease [Mangrovicoccus sp.]